ncbi:hypothetical protein [Streptomyces sp. NBC_01262]|uniref:hypothetical protein n=1 Tax=Streptomyces sp. NBC_01262 TaxID=2903803 RepID=UPI002E325937|nr:hypothetical protein [Streptomyces sp. NBC_01262]
MTTPSRSTRTAATPALALAGTLAVDAIWAIAALTAASGLLVAVRMYETHPRG